MRVNDLDDPAGRDLEGVRADVSGHIGVSGTIHGDAESPIEAIAVAEYLLFSFVS